MNKHATLGWMNCPAGLCAAASFAALFALGCSDGGGGSGGSAGSTSTGGTGGATTSSTGGTGGAGATGGLAGGTGGTGGVAPTCESALPAQHDIQVTFHETGKAPVQPDLGPPVTVTASGTVTAVDNGAIPAGCAGISMGLPGAAISFVDAAGKSWTACYTGPDASLPFVVGDAVDASYQTKKGYLAGNSYGLTLEKEGAVAFAALADDDAALSMPQGISVTNGEEVCVTQTSPACVDHGYRALVKIGIAEAQILPGESGVVGAYQVQVGRWIDVLSPSLSCDSGEGRHHISVVYVP